MSSTPKTYKFFKEPGDNLKCAICLDLADTPKQHEDCGKLFCSDCIEKNGDKPCPVCRVKTPVYFLDKRCKLDITKQIGRLDMVLHIYYSYYICQVPEK